MTPRPYRGIAPRPPADFPVVRGWDRAPVPHAIWDAVEPTFREPFRGITADGKVIAGLYPLAATGGGSPASMVAAAGAYIESLPADRRAELVLPIDSEAWRRWTNAFPRWTPHGILLDDLDGDQRERALRLIEESLSAYGYSTVRNVMKLNEYLGELIDHMRDTFTQWVYWFTLFGEPSAREPWGWQLIGHHLDVHCFVLGEQVVMTPTFLGAEVSEADDGQFAGTRVFERERADALAFINALDERQRKTAVLYPSILTKDLPAELDHPSNGRMRAGAGADNTVIPYEGLSARSLSARQRAPLLYLLETHASLLRETSRARRMEEIEAHLRDTYVSWIGGTGADDAFYYKIHSPVVLVEYDCHRSVFFEADEPMPFHVHVVVRTPNGNDYGRDLLAQHYAQFDHDDPRHHHHHHHHDHHRDDDLGRQR
jgi:hypothetical protein